MSNMSYSKVLISPRGIVCAVPDSSTKELQFYAFNDIVGNCASRHVTSFSKIITDSIKAEDAIWSEEDDTLITLKDGIFHLYDFDHRIQHWVYTLSPRVRLYDDQLVLVKFTGRNIFFANKQFVFYLQLEKNGFGTSFFRLDPGDGIYFIDADRFTMAVQNNLAYLCNYSDQDTIVNVWDLKTNQLRKSIHIEGVKTLFMVGNEVCAFQAIFKNKDLGYLVRMLRLSDKQEMFRSFHSHQVGVFEFNFTQFIEACGILSLCGRNGLLILDTSGAQTKVIKMELMTHGNYHVIHNKHVLHLTEKGNTQTHPIWKYLPWSLDYFHPFYPKFMNDAALVLLLLSKHKLGKYLSRDLILKEILPIYFLIIQDL